MLKIPEPHRSIFQEQIEVSTAALEKYQNDGSKEGTEEFYKHAKILKDIDARLSIAAEIENKKEEGI